MRRIRRFVFLSMLGTVPCMTVDAAAAGDLFVPQQFDSIQSAINAASNGDRILVGPGTYAAPIVIGIKDIHLISTSGPQHTTIAGTGAPFETAAVSMEAGVLEGFRVTGGRTSMVPAFSCNPSFGFRAGGGVFMTGGVVRNCQISGNVGNGNATNDAVGHGVAIVGNGVLQDCVIEVNGGESLYGFHQSVAAGVFVSGEALIERCTIRENHAIGGYVGGLKLGHCGLGGGTVLLRSCVVYGNSGGCGYPEFGGGIQIGTVQWYALVTLENSYVFGQVCGNLHLTGSSAIRPSFTDCNANDVPDEWDCISKSVADSNGDLVPDSCQCLGDVTKNGVVDGTDLAVILNGWGTSGAKFNADIDGSGSVDGSDLAFVLSAWGTCP